VLLVGGLCLFPVTGPLRATEPPAATVQQRGPEPSPETAFQAVLRRYCVGCHNQRTLTAGLALDTADLANVGAHADLWEGVVRKLRGGLMPPAGRPRPDEATYDALASWLERELDRTAAAQPNPGRTQTLHRLNRAEY